MKEKRLPIIRFVSLFLIFCILSVTFSSCSTVRGSEDRTANNDEIAETVKEDMDFQIISDERTTSCISNSDDYEITINNDNGEIFYKDSEGMYPLVITDVNQDGLMRWIVQKEDEVLEGEINTSEAPTPQSTLVIGGMTYIISTALYSMLKCAAAVVISGAICYVADVAGTNIKNNSSSANYFPAYNAFGNVYVATGIGISQATAITRIRKGKHVWAKNARYAYTACIKASPIGAAEWGWHGNRKTSSGYYPHYHAVKYYKSNGQYQHTGAHCWYI